MSWNAMETAPKKRSLVYVYGREVGTDNGFYIMKAYQENGKWYQPNNGDYTDGGYGKDYLLKDVLCWRRVPRNPEFPDWVLSRVKTILGADKNND